MSQTKFKMGNVVKQTDGHKICVMRHNIEKINQESDKYTLVCERPHQDGDFSYGCDFEWCRCMN